MAALMPYAQHPRTSWASLVRVNLGGVANLLLHLLTPPGWVVYVSSTDVYGESRDTAITEQTPPAPQTEYAVTKLFAEYMHTRYCEDQGIPCTILRPCSIYGPGDPSSKVINTFTRKALSGQDLEIHGDGEDLRDFIFVEDAARMVLDVLERRMLGTYNLVTGRSHRILDVVHTLEERLGRPLAVRYHSRRGRRRDWRFARSSLIERGIPVPAMSLPDGLSQVIQAFQAGGVRHAAR
jgi:UDP-glucose 4-epimerase